MKLFTYTVRWDQPISYQFDQDDIKTVGKRQVESNYLVVAPDRDLSDLYLKRWLGQSVKIGGCVEQEVNIFVHPVHATHIPVSRNEIRPVGPEKIDPYWEPRIKAAERY